MRVLQALRDHGYVEGRNFTISYSQFTDAERFYRPDLAKALVGAGVDVIVTIEIAGGQAASHATATIPIVAPNRDPHQQLVAKFCAPRRERHRSELHER